MHDLASVIHVHSTFSDGTATVPELIEATRRADADALLLTDHDSLEARRRGFEGWHGDVLLLVGNEISPRRGHYLAFDLDEEVPHDGLSEDEIAAEVRRRGGIGFAAHPFSGGSRISQRIAKPHPWDAIETADQDGIEVWSLLTEVAESWSSAREVLAFLRRPEEAMVGPPVANLAAWDRLGARRRCVGIAGLDAHQYGLRLGRGRVLSPTPNERYFRFLRTHVLLREPPVGRLEEDAPLVYEALREGRCYMAVDGLAPARGFAFWAESGEKRLEMGAESPIAESPSGESVAAQSPPGESPPGGWTLRARTPEPARLRIVRDGRTVARAEGEEIEHRVEGPGVWRAEAWRAEAGRERAWILSNPIYLRAS